MILYFDTTNPDSTKLALVMESKILEENLAGDISAEEFSQQVSAFLKKNKILDSKISKIAVNQNPSFFSRQRVAVVAANALAYAWKIKILEVKKIPSYKQADFEKGLLQISPKYGAAPSISKPKKAKFTNT